MSGIGGLFYVTLLGLAIISRRYKSHKRNMCARHVPLGVLIFVFAIVLIGGLQAFKVFDINSLVFFKIKDGISSLSFSKDRVSKMVDQNGRGYQ